jgi:hypothetical protein
MNRHSFSFRARYALTAAADTKAVVNATSTAPTAIGTFPSRISAIPR